MGVGARPEAENRGRAHTVVTSDVQHCCLPRAPHSGLGWMGLGWGVDLEFSGKMLLPVLSPEAQAGLLMMRDDTDLKYLCRLHSNPLVKVHSFIWPSV